MINHNKKYIFIHIPKTGGSSIEKTLLSHEGIDISSQSKNILSNLSKDILDEYVLGKNRQHFEMHNFEHKFQENYFSFCFVRNPWDWVVSEFEWMRDFYNDFDEYIDKIKNKIDEFNSKELYKFKNIENYYQEKWFDWFTISNYHIGNNYNKFYK